VAGVEMASDNAADPSWAPSEIRAGGPAGRAAVIWWLRNGVDSLFAADMAWPGFT
jgi:hypothetical protein